MNEALFEVLKDDLAARLVEIETNLNELVEIHVSQVTERGKTSLEVFVYHMLARMTAGLDEPEVLTTQLAAAIKLLAEERMRARVTS